jgi:uncharacterized protein (DUF697 family)
LILELMKIYGQDFTEAFVEAMVKWLWTWIT